MQDKVFVIRKTKYLERDLIVQTFSAQFGKKSFLVRGGQKSKKRFGGGVLETGNLILSEFKESKISSKMGSLLEAEVINGYEKIRLDYDKINLVFYLFKLIERIDWMETEYERLYSLLNNCLISLENTDCLRSLKFIFHVKILYLQGLLPINNITQKWLRLEVKEAKSIDIKGSDFTQYEKIFSHLIKELLPQNLEA